MASSALGHYKVHFYKQKKAEAEDRRDGHEENVQHQKGIVEELRQELERQTLRLSECEAAAQRARDERAEFHSLAEEAEKVAKEDGKSNAERANDDTSSFDPKTGLPEGEKYPVTQGILAALATTQVARRIMEEKGDAAGAAEASARASEYLKEYGDPLPQQAAIALAFGAHHVPAANVVQPRSIPRDDEELTTALEFARERLGGRIESSGLLSIIDEQGTGAPLTADALQVSAMGLNGLRGRGDSAKEVAYARAGCPVGVTLRLLDEVAQHRVEMENFRRSMLQKDRAKADEEDGDEGEEENDNDEEDDDNDGADNGAVPELDDEEWECIASAIRNRIESDKERARRELTLPHASSAQIARYNPYSHFAFESQTAQSTVDLLQQGLLQCRLRDRPMGFSGEEPRARTPFQLPAHGALSHFDIDGDLMAACGDQADNEMRAYRGYCSYGKVPVAVNLEECTKEFDLKDASGSSKPWEEASGLMSRCFAETRKVQSSKEAQFELCRADAKHNLVWAASCTSGKIFGFSAEDGAKRKDRLVAMLSTGPAAHAEADSPSALACCGHLLVGCSKGRLLVWDINKAKENFPGPGSVKLYCKRNDSEDSFWDSDDSDDKIKPKEESSGPQKKKVKASPYGGMEPRMIAAKNEKDRFSCSQVEWLGGSKLLTAPSGRSSDLSLRIYDLAAESVTGILCGVQAATIGRQYCYDSHNLIFCSDASGTGFAWDTRTYQPAFSLHAETRSFSLMPPIMQHFCVEAGCLPRILGVPTHSPVAFTYGPSESIACWDLRMPASHAYTMSTGNSNVIDLFWHERSASIVAATKYEHHVTHGRYGGYMYGERLTEEEEDELSVYDWHPWGAQHEPKYFGADDFTIGHSTRIIMYSFENGKRMDGREL